MGSPQESNRNPDASIIALVLLLALLWGGNSVAIKIGLQDIPPLALAGFRFIIGLIAVTGWALWQRVRIRMEPGEFVPLIYISVIFLFQIIALNVGTHYTTSSRSIVLNSTYPLFTTLLAHFMVQGDRLTVAKVVGILLAFVGVTVTFRESLNLGSNEYLVGDIVVLISGLLLGLRVVTTKVLVQSIHPYRLLIWSMLLTLPWFFILSLIFEQGWEYRVSFSSVTAIFYQGLVVAGFCFVAWTSVLRHYKASRLVVLFFATPLFGVVLSNLLLDEPLGLELISGAVLVAAGIYLVNRTQERDQ
ncbi:MAG: DMT family transporter [Chloroflexota bacterium]|nr:DMT family transporter [Chloroflexota bacterium]MDE2930205.1 DMT family transporter [Chloroflexota bacterium]